MTTSGFCSLLPLHIPLSVPWWCYHWHIASLADTFFNCMQPSCHPSLVGGSQPPIWKKCAIPRIPKGPSNGRVKNEPVFRRDVFGVLKIKPFLRGQDFYISQIGFHFPQIGRFVLFDCGKSICNLIQWILVLFVVGQPHIYIYIWKMTNKYLKPPLRILYVNQNMASCLPFRIQPHWPRKPV